MPATLGLSGHGLGAEKRSLSQWAQRSGFCYGFGYLIRLVQECAFRAAILKVAAALIFGIPKSVGK
jgi:hypothetical protein